jgi:hypothetical protein
MSRIYSLSLFAAAALVLVASSFTGLNTAEAASPTRRSPQQRAAPPQIQPPLRNPGLQPGSTNITPGRGLPAKSTPGRGLPGKPTPGRSLPGKPKPTPTLPHRTPKIVLPHIDRSAKDCDLSLNSDEFRSAPNREMANGTPTASRRVTCADVETLMPKQPDE